MKKIFKNASLIALGLVAGLSLSSFGALEEITAVKDNVTSIFIKGQQVDTSGENTPISYKNRLYVPLRFVSENLNMDVNYEKSTKSVTISQKPLTKEEQIARDAQIYKEAEAIAAKLKSTDEEKARKEDVKVEQKVVYNNLPVSYRDDNFIMKLTMIVRSNGYSNSEYYFDVENNNQEGMNIDPMSFRFNYTKNGNDMELDLSDVAFAHMDIRPFSSIPTGYNDKIFLNANKIPNDVKEGTVSFNIYRVGQKDNIKKVIMPVKFD